MLPLLSSGFFPSEGVWHSRYNSVLFLGFFSESRSGVCNIDLPAVLVYCTADCDSPWRFAVRTIFDSVFHNRLDDQLRNRLIQKRFIYINGIIQTGLVADLHAVEIFLDIIKLFAECYSCFSSIGNITHDPGKIAADFKADHLVLSGTEGESEGGRTGTAGEGA